VVTGANGNREIVSDAPESPAQLHERSSGFVTVALIANFVIVALAAVVAIIVLVAVWL